MLVGNRLAGFQFDDETIFDKEIGIVIAEDRFISVANSQRMLLFHLHPEFAQPVPQTVFIDLFQVAVAQEPMQFERDLPNPITQRQNVLLFSHLVPFVPFVAMFLSAR